MEQLFNRQLFAEDLKEYRSKEGLSAEKFCIKYRISINTLRGIEWSKTNPKLNTYYHMCKLMGKDFNHYFKVS